MSRTEELRKKGAKDRTGSAGGGTPFVKWSNDYGWVEGTVEDVWEGKFGMSATLKVTAHSEGLEAHGKDEQGEKYTVPLQNDVEINVGLNYAALKDSITKEDKGKHFHIAFEGWGESKNGDQYRIFACLEVPTKAERAKPGQNAPRYGKDEPWPEPEGERKPAARGTGRAPKPMTEPDDDLPFAPLRLTAPWL